MYPFSGGPNPLTCSRRRAGGRPEHGSSPDKRIVASHEENMHKKLGPSAAPREHDIEAMGVGLIMHGRVSSAFGPVVDREGGGGPSTG